MGSAAKMLIKFLSLLSPKLIPNLCWNQFSFWCYGAKFEIKEYVNSTLVYFLVLLNVLRSTHECRSAITVKNYVFRCQQRRHYNVNGRVVLTLDAVLRPSHNSKLHEIKSSVIIFLMLRKYFLILNSTCKYIYLLIISTNI